MTEVGSMRRQDEVLAEELGLLDASSARRLRFLRDGYRGTDRWVLFVGAGVSSGVGIPNWDRLARQLADNYGVDFPEPPADGMYPTIIQDCLKKAPSAEHFWSSVADAVCGSEPGEMHTLLMQLPFEACLTTNFDCLLEGPHAGLDGLATPPVLSYPHLTGPQIAGRRLIHLHGRCNHDEALGPQLDEASTVLTESAYQHAYGGATNLPLVLECAIDAYQFLFIGASLGDWQIQTLLRKVRERGRTAGPPLFDSSQPLIRGYAFVEWDGRNTGSAADYSWPGKVVGIEPIFYRNPDGDHVALQNAVRWLVSETASGSSASRYEVAE